MAELDNKKRMIKIDDKEYDLAGLSQNARNQVAGLRMADQEIARLRQRLAIAQTARAAYAQALASELPNDS